MQVMIGKGSGLSRLIWWPRWGHIGLRVWGHTWFSLYWRRAGGNGW